MPTFGFDFASGGTIRADALILTGGATVGGALAVTGRTTTGGLSLSIDGDTTTAAINWVGDENNGIIRGGADDGRLVAGGSARALWSSGLGFNTPGAFIASGNVTFNNPVTFANYADFNEISAPAAPSADKARVFAVVDGTTKTDLSAIFQSGVAQVFTQEP